VENTAIEYPSHLSKSAVSFIDNLLKKNPAERMTEQETLNHPFLLQVNDKQV
jgi:serine/threonine protein kinase